MKNILILTLFISTHAMAKVGKVPSFWTSSDNEERSTMKSLDISKTFKMMELEDAYQNILEAKMGLFKDIQVHKDSRWKLQSIKTELAIEGEGTLGVMGVGGEAAVELIWLRKKRTPSAPIIPAKLDEEVTPEVEEIQISTEMSEEALKKEIAPIVDLAMATGHIKKRSNLFRNLFQEALKFQKTARELESTPVMGPWYAYKYQLELYVSFEGDILFLEVGNSIRLRLDWYRVKKDTASLVRPPLLSQELSANAQFVSSIAADIEAMDSAPFENGFRFNSMKVGVGTAVEGDLFFAKAKTEAIGSIFFKRDEVTEPTFNLSATRPEVTDYKFASKGSIVKIPRFSFRKGIEKALIISHFFARNAKIKEESGFELSVIETEFELYKNGGVGIVTVEGSAVLSLFVTKNVTI